MKLKLISCEVLYREMCDAVARSPHQVDVEFLTKGLHDLGGAKMRSQLQARVDATQGYDAVLMGYALCGNGVAGLTARAVPLIIPRAHDCIALLLGSRERYQQYFDANQGVYFRSTGWLERGESLEQLRRTGTGSTLEELIERYGADNGTYLFEELHRYRSTYRQLTYIKTGLEPDGSFEARAEEEAVQRGWAFEKVTGSLTLFRSLVNGDWNDADFLTVPPGYRVAVRYDDSIITAERCEP